VTTYLVRRILQAIPLLLVISLVLFTILQLLPEKPWDILLHNPRMTAADKARLLAYYGFNRPFLEQYLTYMRNLLRFDLGFSYFSHQSTVSLIAERLPNTALLMGSSYIFTLLIAIPIGIIAAVKQYSKLDNVLTTGAFIGISLPQFWFGVMLIIVLSVLPFEHFGFRLFPTDGMWDSGHEGNLAQLNFGDPLNLAWHLVLPGIVLAVQSIAQYSRFVRSSMLDALNQDYIRTARAKGLSPLRVVVGHAFRNSLLPLITLMGLDVPQLFAGALITEQVFTWPGVGRLFWDSAGKGDYQVLLGIMIILAGLVVLGNLIADLAYGWADPRIQYR
jgi:peptide/nickel transport system permease protein